MDTNMADERPCRDTVIVPSILVMPGDPFPAEFCARYSQAFRVPVRIVWRDGTSRGSALPSPRGDRAAARLAAGDSALPEATPAAEAALGGAVAEVPPVGWFYGSGNPVGAYLRANDALDRVLGQHMPEPDVVAQATTPHGATDAAPRDKVATANVVGRYVADNPRQWIGRPSVGTAECVPLVRAATGAPRAAEWHPGPLVQGNLDIRPGTAIAIFDSNGHYTGHTAIYLGQNEKGIQVIDQWNNRGPDGHIISQHQPRQRTLFYGQPWRLPVDRGESYRVVE